MKEFVEKLIGRLLLESSGCKVYKLINPNKEDIAEFNAYKKCIEIVNQLAEEYGKDTNVTTNADFIRKMNDEELAEFLINFKNTFGEEHEGQQSCVDWLQSEVKGSDV